MRRLTNVTLVLFILLNLVFVTSSASAAPERADRGPWAPNVSYGGLNQPASGAAPGAYEPGIQDYELLVAQCPPTGTVAGTAEVNGGATILPVPLLVR